jgi:hypothetical protein
MALKDLLLWCPLFLHHVTPYHHLTFHPSSSSPQPPQLAHPKASSPCPPSTLLLLMNSDGGILLSFQRAIVGLTTLPKVSGSKRCRSSSGLVSNPWTNWSRSAPVRRQPGCLCSPSPRASSPRWRRRGSSRQSLENNSQSFNLIWSHGDRLGVGHRRWDEGQPVGVQGGPGDEDGALVRSAAPDGLPGKMFLLLRTD